MKSIFFILLAFAGLASTGLHAQDAPTLPSITQALADEPMTSKLAAALDAAELSATIDGSTEVLLLAPTDDAFAALPEGILEALLQPENIDALRSILANHVVDGDSSMAAEKLSMSEATAQKQIECSNGLVYMIDKVLIPEDFDPSGLE